MSCAEAVSNSFSVPITSRESDYVCSSSSSSSSYVVVIAAAAAAAAFVVSKAIDSSESVLVCVATYVVN